MSDSNNKKHANKETEKRKLSDLTGAFKVQADSIRQRIQDTLNQRHIDKALQHSLDSEGNKKEHVVLVHGLFLHGTYTKVMSHWLRKAGFTTTEFSYRTIQANLDTNAERLYQHFQSIDAEVIHAVGHSLGGVLLQHLYANFDMQNKGRVVALGSPFLGSAVARFLSQNPLASVMLGKSIADTNSKKQPEWKSKHELGIIAGDIPVGLGTVLGKVLEKPNDGTVSVTETQLPGYKEHIVLPVAHTALIFSPKTTEKVVCFLQKGCFDESD